MSLTHSGVAIQEEDTELDVEPDLRNGGRAERDDTVEPLTGDNVCNTSDIQYTVIRGQQINKANYDSSAY
jgi:hypothetical protein